MAEIKSHDEKTENLKARIAERDGLSEDRADELVQLELKTMKEMQKSEIPEDLLRFHAARSVWNEKTNLNTSFEGEVEEIPALTLGYQEKEGDYFVTEDGYKALVGLALVNPKDESVSPGISTVVIDGSHGVDIEFAKELFEPLKTIKMVATRRQVGSREGENTIRKGNLPTYVCQSTNDTVFEEIDPEEEPSDSVFSELPSEHEEKREMVNNDVLGVESEVSIQNVHEHVTDRTQSGNGRAFETAFGVDIKRFHGTIVDVFDNGDGFGVMTCIDETVFDESDVPEDLMTDQMRTAGLQCFDIAPDHLIWAEDSIVDVYGYIEQSDDGQYRMRPFGMVPVVGYARDTETGTTDESIEEETI